MFVCFSSVMGRGEEMRTAQHSWFDVVWEKGREERERQRELRLLGGFGYIFLEQWSPLCFPGDSVEAWLFMLPPLTEACRSLTSSAFSRIIIWFLSEQNQGGFHSA